MKMVRMEVIVILPDEYGVFELALATEIRLREWLIEKGVPGANILNPVIAEPVEVRNLEN